MQCSRPIYNNFGHTRCNTCRECMAHQGFELIEPLKPNAPLRHSLAPASAGEEFVIICIMICFGCVVFSILGLIGVFG